MTPSEMLAAIDELAPRVFHGEATGDERADLARLLTLSPENRRRFLDHAALHGMLSRAAKAGALAENPNTFFQSLETSPAPKRNAFRKFWIPAAAAAAIALASLPFLPMSASAALDHIIAATTAKLDRTYQIEAPEDRSNKQAPPRSDRGRFPVETFLDHSTLWLRGADEFVLRQDLPNGETRILGANASESWTIRGNNPVSLSHDASRFGGGLLAKHRELAFLDLRHQLADLKRLYQIEWLDKSSSGRWKIRGTRANADQGGAKEIELWFDPASGLLERMILRQLPRANGGPRDISVVLESTNPLPADFFTHTHHHEPGRPVLTTPEP